MLITIAATATVSTIMRGHDISTQAGIGFAVGSAIATLGIVTIITSIPVGIYWIIERKRMPGMMITVWVFVALVSIIGLITAKT